jgi:hypothetical protein
MDNKIQIIKWGSDYLVSKGYEIDQPPEIFLETPWSTVIRFSTSTGFFYLKKTPADLFTEPEIIEIIQKNKPDSPLPHVLFKSRELNCFLMTSCGDHSLRTKFNGSIDPQLLLNGLNSYIEIMRSFEQNQDVLEAAGVPNWRINHIPTLYTELLAKKAMLLEEGLTEDELVQLMKLAPKIKSICEFISEQKVKDILVNGDFNENNLIINEKTQKISIIDWGECVITHPFFTIAGHLQSSARRYKLEVKGHFLENIRKKCISRWLDVASEHELEAIYQNILRLLPIYSSLATYRLQAATQNKSKEVQTWFIAEFLRTLLESERKG